MADYSPNTPYNVPFFLWVPTWQTVKGVRVKVLASHETPYFCSFRTFGGTEKVVNDIITLEDTATLETWYDPTITADCEIEVDNQKYEILGTPENINRRNQYLVIKVRAIKGGA